MKVEDGGWRGVHLGDLMHERLVKWDECLAFVDVAGDVDIAGGSGVGKMAYMNIIVIVVGSGCVFGVVVDDTALKVVVGCSEAARRIHSD